jgi:hypothetical protein
MATADDNDARANPRRRPIARIRNVAGTVVAARLTTMIETGRVAKAGLPVRPEPMMPPRVTMTIEPVAEIS